MKIENYREANPAEKFIAKFDISLANGMMLHEWKVLKGKKGGYFAVAPSFSKEGEFGEKKYFPYITFSREKDEVFKKELMELLKEFVRT